MYHWYQKLNERLKLHQAFTFISSIHYFLLSFSFTAEGSPGQDKADVEEVATL
jgi:hypothetical protein